MYYLDDKWAPGAGQANWPSPARFNPLNFKALLRGRAAAARPLRPELGRADASQVACESLDDFGLVMPTQADSQK
jgi:hypothetical protein